MKADSKLTLSSSYWSTELCKTRTTTITH